MVEQGIGPVTKSEAKSHMKSMTYKEKEILCIDYINLKGQEIVNLIPVVTQLMFDDYDKDLLLLIDLTNSFVNKETVDAFGESGKKVKPILKKTAVLGITGLKKVLLNTVNKISNAGAKAFTSDEEAKEWLIS